MLLTAVAAALAVTVGMARTDLVPEKLKAGGFELLDENGKVGHTDDDQERPGIFISDANGKLRTALKVTKDGPGLELRDGNKGNRIA